MSQPQSPPQRPELRNDLLQCVERDQEVRHALGDEPTTEQWDAMAAVDLENYTWLEQVIAVHGWPGFRLVGEDGAEAAWLIAQHSPKHLQQQWLPLLRRPSRPFRGVVAAGPSGGEALCNDPRILVTPLPGVNRDNLLAQLRDLHMQVSNPACS